MTTTISGVILIAAMAAALAVWMDVRASLWLGRLLVRRSKALKAARDTYRDVWERGMPSNSIWEGKMADIPVPISDHEKDVLYAGAMANSVAYVTGIEEKRNGEVCMWCEKVIEYCTKHVPNGPCESCTVVSTLTVENRAPEN